MPHPFPDYLRAAMKVRGVKPGQLARAVTALGSKTSRANVYSWLRGSLPGDDRRPALADALGVPLPELAARCAGDESVVRTAPFQDPEAM